MTTGKKSFKNTDAPRLYIHSSYGSWFRRTQYIIYNVHVLIYYIYIHTHVYTAYKRVQTWTKNMYSECGAVRGTAPDYPLKGSWKMYFPRAYSENLHPATVYTRIEASVYDDPSSLDYCYRQLYDWWTSHGFSPRSLPSKGSCLYTLRTYVLYL